MQISKKLLFVVLNSLALSLSATALAATDAPASATIEARNATATITLLGTMGGPPLDANSRRAETSTLLTVGDRNYLIDAGTGVTRRLREYGIRPYEVRNIFITHGHLDHTAGLGSLISEDWFNGWFYHDPYYMNKADNKPFTTIYGPPDMGTVFDGIMTSLSVSARIFNADDTGAGTIKSPEDVFTFHSVDAYSQPVTFYNDGVVKVTAVENTHYGVPMPETLIKHKDFTYAYRFDTPAGSIVFTGDTGPSKNVEELAKGADVLVSEVLDFDLMLNKDASAEGVGVQNAPNKEKIRNHMLHQHLSPEEVGKLAQQAGVKTVVLYHVVPGDAALTYSHAFVAGVKKYFSGTVIAGHDFTQYTLVK